ncbi:CapA family protein [Halalkalicoccus ordinarius]|uniref:CapA family protein n=1 Tax=Halalkalicoccus ordinarius TaxID=3116651 RepID=UPI00300F7396
MRLGFTGDVMLGRKVDERQRRRSVEAVWGDLRGRLRALDGLFVNLECCLSTRGRPWRRTNHPFHFRADPDWAIPALSDVGVDFASLANNHVLDFEEPALLDTLRHLDEADIAHAGAGRDRREAFEPAIVEVEDLRIAVIALTDNTPEYAAGPDSPGTARIEIDVEDGKARTAIDRALDRARERDPDLLVASLHWRPNMVTEPPETFEEFARWLVDRGVDLLHGHSAHVFQGIELYDGAPICYDCGDFVDDYAVDSDLRNDRGFLFELRIADGEIEELRLVPTEISDCAVHPASKRAAAWSRERMRDLSEPFGTEFKRDGEHLVVEP